MNILIHLKPAEDGVVVVVNGGTETKMTDFIAVQGQRGWSWLIHYVPAGSVPAVYLDGFRDGNIIYSSRENIYVGKDGTGLLLGETGPFVSALKIDVADFMLKNGIRSVRRNLPSVFTERKEKKMGKSTIYYTVQFRPFKVVDGVISDLPEQPVAGSYLLDKEAKWVIECTSTFANPKATRGPNVWKELYVPSQKTTPAAPAPAPDEELDLTTGKVEKPTAAAGPIPLEVTRNPVPVTETDLAAAQREFALAQEAITGEEEEAGSNLL